jgi:dihydrofolate synthase/folylpolyglutamate synthase
VTAPAKPHLSETLQALYARVPLGMRLGLDAMREACAANGHPENAFETVHVAGTNGKGSVSAMVESIARASGKKTGLFTSPHLSRFAERIRIDGEPLDDATLRDLLGDALVRGPALSFFETATLAAFLAFRDAGVEIAVIEVGLGGRLDATNVIPRPRAAGITRIALDHTDRLGTTLAEIAREKAGIAKPGLDLALGPMSAEVRAVIDGCARAAGATTSSADDDPDAVAFVKGARLGLSGAHQASNARLAYVLGRRLGAGLDACAQGLASVRWPGRLERIETPEGPVLLDAAHNPDGVASLVEHLASLEQPASAPAPVALVFGVLADKAWPEMLDRLASAVDRRFYVTPEGRAAVAPETLANRHPGVIALGVEAALARARASVGPHGLVVVAGSILLIGDVRSRLLGLPRDPPVAM